MNAREALRTATGNLSTHKLRTALTMLGMIFGVSSVVSMLSIGAGAERQALEMIEQMGVRNVLVRGKELKREELELIRKKSPGVSWRDAQAIAEAVAGVSQVAGRVRIDAYKILAQGAKTEAKVFGVSCQAGSSLILPVREGRFLDVYDERTHGQVCVVSPGVRRDLFGYEQVIGRDLKVNDVWLEVVGVLAGNDVKEGNQERSTAGRTIYLPVTTAVRKFDRDALEAPLDEVVVQLDDRTSPLAAAAVIRGLVDRIHGGAQDYEVVVPEELLNQSRRTQRIFSIVMGAIAGISLLVGGIGIMNIMLATVFERTREIGIRRAVGARRRDIRDQFLTEAFMISVIGGMAGVVLGVGLAKAVAFYAGWPTLVTLWSIIASAGVSVAVGLASGLYPAYRAANLDPIEALRYE
ncbi:MAG: ABC transporter permease [Acidobacteria bacterium]|nr:ABC transporter permease [Acidobacteriota bacterium]